MSDKPRDWCGQHQAKPGECFHRHYPLADRPGGMFIYLAGPMRGYENFNFPAFDRAREELRRRGYVVACPAERDRQRGFDETKNTLEGFDMHGAFKWDVSAILKSDAVVVLRGWEQSQGARLEVDIARAIGTPVLVYPEMVSADD